MRRHAWNSWLILLIGGVALLAGCATIGRSFGGWFGEPTPAPAPEATPVAGAAPVVYYAGSAGLKVYREPSASSKVVGALAVHEKVVRFKLERGYAYVESAESGAKGWVDNAQLIWRLPAAPKTSAPAPGESEPEDPAAAAPEEPAPAAPEEAQESDAVEPTATAEERVPAPTSTPVPVAPQPEETPGGVAPSIFDAY